MVKDKIKNISSKIIKLLKNLSEVFAKLSNLQQRIITSIILIPIAIYAIYFSDTLFVVLTISIAILMAFEWIDLIKTAKKQAKWRFFGFIYILIPIMATIKLRDIDPNIVLWMFFIIWTTDIFAYFAGKNLGGPKLAPKISPSKTWSGLIGAVVGSMLIGFLSSFMFVTGNMSFFIIVSGILAVISQISDLIESKCKRIFKTKDTGNVIPGHGGVLDRMDGFILVAPISLLVVCFNLGKFVLL